MNPFRPIHNVEQMLQRASSYGISPKEQPIPIVLNGDEPDYSIRLVPVDGGELDFEEEMLVARVERFFTRNLVRDRVIPVVQDKNPCALRDLFWLVTNYFGVHQTRYMVPNEDYPITLVDDYQAWIDQYGKDNYDTYQRGGRHFNVVCDEDPSFCFRETISQLMWFEWAIRRLVIEYASMHIDGIRTHHKEITRQNEQRKKQAGKKFKRQPLTQRPQRGMHVLPGQVSLRVRY